MFSETEHFSVMQSASGNVGELYSC